MDPVRRSLISKAALAVGLWVGFWGLSLVVAGALFWVPFAQSTSGEGVDPLGWFALVAGAGVLWALRPRSWFAKKEKGWAPLSTEEAPQLHAFVQEVASRCGARPPDEIGLEEGATASIGMERRGLRRIRRVNIGFPLFGFLDRDQLGAVLAHEFGHHQGGDLLLGPWVYRTRASLAQALDSLEGSALFLDLPFRAYGRMFLDVSGSVSRGQELAADARSVSVYGRRATWSALEKIHRIAPRWSVYLHAVAISVIEHGCRVPMLDGFRAFLARRSVREELQRRVEEIESRAPKPSDTHPPLDERLTAIDVHGRALAASREDGPGCLELLGGEQAAEALFYSRATKGKLPEVRWGDVAREVLVPAQVKRFAEGPLALERVGPGELPRLLSDWSSLTPTLTGGGPSFLSPAAERARVHRLLEDWLTAALALRDFVPSLEPGGSITLRRGSETVEPPGVILALAEGRLSASEYRTLSQRWDVRG